MSKLLLLPGAKFAPPELQTEFGEIPSAMIPMGSRPALQYIAERFLEQGFELSVAVHQGAELVQQFVARHPELNAVTVDVGTTQSLGETVARALHSLQCLPDELVINFADTYVGDEIQGGDVICYQERQDLYRWTSFLLGPFGEVFDIVDKGRMISAPCPRPVFVGLFAFADVARFVRCLDVVLETVSNGDVDPFYDAVAAYWAELAPEQRCLQPVAQWSDFGHIDTYYATRRALWLGQRVFNDVRVDGTRGVLRKSSTEVKKFLGEIQWYLKLPKQLQHIAPRVLDYQLEGDKPFVELEFYGYPALNDMFLFGNLDPGVWHGVLESVGQLLEQMHRCETSAMGTGSRTAAMREMYEGKTYSRLNPILQDDRFAAFCVPELMINGERCLGLSAALRALPTLCQDAHLYDQTQFTVLHGDLCLSNILFDRKNRFVRVIDPRGGFGEFDIYGDPRYDLAKLSHSFEGDYDFLVAGLFDLTWARDGLQFEVHLNEGHLQIKKLYKEWLARRVSDQADIQIRLIESLLFLSMVPLHSDRFKSQQAYLARGLQLITSVVRALERGRRGCIA